MKNKKQKSRMSMDSPIPEVGHTEVGHGHGLGHTSNTLQPDYVNALPKDSLELSARLNHSLPFKVAKHLSSVIDFNNRFGKMNDSNLMDFKGLSNVKAPESISIGSIQIAPSLSNGDLNKTCLNNGLISTLIDRGKFILNSARSLAKMLERKNHVAMCIVNGVGFGKITAVDASSIGLFNVPIEIKNKFVDNINQFNKEYISKCNMEVLKAFESAIASRIKELQSDILAMDMKNKDLLVNTVSSIPAAMLPISQLQLFYAYVLVIDATFFNVLKTEWDTIVDSNFAKVTKRVMFKNIIEEGQIAMVNNVSSADTIKKVVRAEVAAVLNNNGSQRPQTSKEKAASKKNKNPVVSAKNPPAPARNPKKKSSVKKTPPKKTPVKNSVGNKATSKSSKKK